MGVDGVDGGISSATVALSASQALDDHHVRVVVIVTAIMVVTTVMTITAAIMIAVTFVFVMSVLMSYQR